MVPGIGFWWGGARKGESGRGPLALEGGVGKEKKKKKKNEIVW